MWRSDAGSGSGVSLLRTCNRNAAIAWAYEVFLPQMHKDTRCTNVRKSMQSLTWGGFVASGLVAYSPSLNTARVWKSRVTARVTVTFFGVRLCKLSLQAAKVALNQYKTR